MKTKKKLPIIIFSVLLLLIAAAVGALQFTDWGYILTIPYRSNFEEIGHNVYLHKADSLTPEDVRAVTDRAEERVKAFFGDMHSLDETIVIICDDEKISKKIGDKVTHTFLWPSGRDYICLSNEYFNVDIVAHEFTHAELHWYLSDEARKSLPLWFDEGMATQNDYRERYSYESWVERTDNGANVTALKDMDEHSEFHCKDDQERQFHYICAKHEIAGWLDGHSTEEMISFIKSINDGGDFYARYEDFKTSRDKSHDTGHGRVDR